jgi:hypothetical protein
MSDKQEELIEGIESVEELRDEELVEDVEVSEETSAELEEAKGEDGETSGEVATTKAAEPTTKAGMLKATYDKLSKMKKEDLKTAMGKLFAESEDEMDDDDEDEDEEEMKETKGKVKESYDFQDDLSALTDSEATLSEGFKDKAAVIFEAAIKSKVSEEIDRLEDEYSTQLEEETAKIQSDLVEKVDGYLNYVVENWMEENKVAIETGLRAELAESFISNLKDVFESHYVDIPEDKINVVDELSEKVAELEESLNGSIEDNIKLNEKVAELSRDRIIAEATEGMTVTDAEKLKGLVEDVDFDDVETFAKKVSTVKEAYFKPEIVESKIDEADVAINEAGDEVEVSGMMAAYAGALSKTARK